MENTKQAIIDEIIAQIDLFVKENKSAKRTFIIGIDGRCGSGKTTLSKMLVAHYHANCFHMDDFYLPLDMRTRERMSQPGGNVHYERFLEEVIAPVRAGEPVIYQTYDCSTQSLKTLGTYDPKSIVIVEGAYALHPLIREHYDFKLFVTHTPECQKSRILERNGEKKLYEFELRWIPLEEFYISNCKPDAICNVLIDTSKAW
jgi:uridine kinase